MTIHTKEHVYNVLKIRSMYDGDSAKVTCYREFIVAGARYDFGFGDIIEVGSRSISKYTDIDCRMYGYDCPELRDKRPDWKAAAYLARDVARKWMEEAIESGSLKMQSHLVKDREEKGKFGRYLSNFWDERKNQLLMDFLINRQLAVSYHGQNKAEIEDAHETNIHFLKMTGEI